MSLTHCSESDCHFVIVRKLYYLDALARAAMTCS